MRADPEAADAFSFIGKPTDRLIAAF